MGLAAVGLDAGADDGGGGEGGGVAAEELGAVMRALLVLDAGDEVAELDLAVGVVHVLTLAAAGAVGGEARAASAPVALRLARRGEREALALVADGAGLVGDDAGAEGVGAGVGGVAEEAELAVPPGVGVARWVVLALRVVRHAGVSDTVLGVGVLDAGGAGGADVVGDVHDVLVVVGDGGARVPGGDGVEASPVVDVTPLSGGAVGLAGAKVVVLGHAGHGGAGGGVGGAGGAEEGAGGVELAVTALALFRNGTEGAVLEVVGVEATEVVGGDVDGQAVHGDAAGQDALGGEGGVAGHVLADLNAGVLLQGEGSGVGGKTGLEVLAAQ